MMAGAGPGHGPIFPDGMSRGQALLWGAAAVTAMIAHVGGVAWALRQPPITAAEAAAPAAVMIELAPEPVAPEPVADEAITPDTMDAPQIAAPPEDLLAPPAPAPTPPEVLPPAPTRPPDAPRPIEQAAAEPPPPVPPTVEPPPEQPAEVAEARPRARPTSLASAEAPEERVDREPEVATAPSNAARRQQVNAAPADTAAARQTSAGTAGSASAAKWQARLLAHLERRKRYPSGARGRREEGVAYVRFAIDDSGAVLSVRLARSSGFSELDEAVVALVRRASPVPAPPPGAPRSITAPVQFRIR